MKKTTVLIVLVTVILLMLVVPTNGISASSHGEIDTVKVKTDYTAHNPIYIDGNSGFTSANGVTSGSGTQADPYIIENWDIDASSANGIEIRNTDAYFIIKNCVIHDGKSNYNEGIRFYNVTNGKIDNVTSYNNYYGIGLDSSSNNNISNCAAYNNNYGIYLYSSSNNSISNCAVYNNYYYGICLGSSSNNQITNCAVYNNYDYGIYLGYSSNNQISNCAVYNNDNEGILLYAFSNNNLIMNCTIYNNHNGIYLKCYTYKDHAPSYNQIINCPIYNNSNDGIYLDRRSSGNQISNCAVYNNHHEGIYLGYSSNNNIISNCDVYNNYYGIRLYYSSNNKLRNNTLNSNTYNFGVYGRGGISYYYQDIDTTNTINSKPIYYIIGQNGVVFNESMSIGYFGLISCTNIIVENLTLTNNIQGLLLVNTSCSTLTSCAVYNNSEGIYLYYSLNNQITTCIIHNNSEYGICLYHYSSNNKISNCTITNNENGICLFARSKKNIVKYCDINSNRYGVSIKGEEAEDNEIHYSHIYNNKEYGVTASVTISPVDATHNWWGTKDGPSAAGSGGGDNVSINVLYEPWLTEPVGINHPPIVNSITANPTTVTTGETVTITVSATDEDGNALTYHYSCTGGTISGTGNIVTWIAPNTAGTYTVSVYVNDGTVNSNSKSVSITVTAPETATGTEKPKEEGKRFIPSFEAVYLLAIIGICTLLLRNKRKQRF